MAPLCLPKKEPGKPYSPSYHSHNPRKPISWKPACVFLIQNLGRCSAHSTHHQSPFAWASTNTINHGKQEWKCNGISNSVGWARCNVGMCGNNHFNHNARLGTNHNTPTGFAGFSAHTHQPTIKSRTDRSPRPAIRRSIGHHRTQKTTWSVPAHPRTPALRNVIGTHRRINTTDQHLAAHTMGKAELETTVSGKPTKLLNHCWVEAGRTRRYPWISVAKHPNTCPRTCTPNGPAKHPSHSPNAMAIPQPKQFFHGLFYANRCG